MRRSKEKKVVKFQFFPKNQHCHRHFAEPGHVHIEAGDEVVFCGVNTTVTVFIPKNPFVEGGRRDLVFSLKRRERKVFIVGEKVREGEEYPYAAYCRNGNDFAEGGSPPRMIVGGGIK